METVEERELCLPKYCSIAHKYVRSTLVLCVYVLRIELATMFCQQYRNEVYKWCNI